jgi:hypothetical protein
VRAVDHSLPVDVRYLHLSSRGLCLADSVVSQRSPSPQSVASVRVCCLSCHVFAIANRRFSQRSASPQSIAFIPVCYLSYHVFAIANRRFLQPSLSPQPAITPYLVVPSGVLNLLFCLERLLHFHLRPYACARCMFAYASRTRCMQPVYRSSFRTMTFGAYRAFQAWARSTRAVRNHFFLLMHQRLNTTMKAKYAGRPTSSRATPDIRFNNPRQRGRKGG